jgi:hypothetical protein
MARRVWVVDPSVVRGERAAAVDVIARQWKVDAAADADAATAGLPPTSVVFGWVSEWVVVGMSEWSVDVFWYATPHTHSELGLSVREHGVWRGWVGGSGAVSSRRRET